MKSQSQASMQTINVRNSHCLSRDYVKTFNNNYGSNINVSKSYAKLEPIIPISYVSPRPEDHGFEIPPTPTKFVDSVLLEEQKKNRYSMLFLKKVNNSQQKYKKAGTIHTPINSNALHLLSIKDQSNFTSPRDDLAETPKLDNLPLKREDI